MTTNKNRLRLDYKDIPDLKAPLGGLAAGDRCKVTFELMVVANEDGGLEGDIEGVEYDLPDAEESADKSGETDPSAEEPVMVVISKRKGSSDKKKAMDMASDA